MAVTDYTQLETWQRAMDLAQAVHAATKSYPRDELYGLVSQTRRSAVSVPSNIASRTLIEQSHTVARLLNGLIRSVAPPADSY